MNAKNDSTPWEQPQALADIKRFRADMRAIGRETAEAPRHYDGAPPTVRIVLQRESAWEIAFDAIYSALMYSWTISLAGMYIAQGLKAFVESFFL